MNEDQFVEKVREIIKDRVDEKYECAEVRVLPKDAPIPEFRSILFNYSCPETRRDNKRSKSVVFKVPREHIDDFIGKYRSLEDCVFNEIIAPPVDRFLESNSALNGNHSGEQSAEKIECSLSLEK